MNDEPVQISRPGVAEERVQEKHKRSLKEWFIHEAKRLFFIFVYLFVFLSLFSIYESIILAKHNITYRPYGFALINAWLLAKVILIAEDLHLGDWFFKDRPLIYPILFKSFVFAVVLICFFMAEKAIVGVWKGKAIAESVAGFGGGGLIGVVSVGAIMFVVMIPFFVYREISHVIGQSELRSLIFTSRTKIGKLQSKGQ
jgi:hypothetical protein